MNDITKHQRGSLNSAHNSFDLIVIFSPFERGMGQWEKIDNF